MQYDQDTFWQWKSRENYADVVGQPVKVPISWAAGMVQAVQNGTEVHAGLSRYLLLSFRETHDKQVWDAVRTRAEQAVQEALQTDTLEQCNAGLPTAFWWETNYGGKRRYPQLRAALQKVVQLAAQYPLTEAEYGDYLLMLADIAESITIEMYEYARFVVDALRQAITLSIVEKPDAADPRIAAAIYKAVRCGWVHPERCTLYADHVMKNVQDPHGPMWKYAVSEQLRCRELAKRGLL